jgi:DNA (cytosine-5)-methyltransferase 1|nr:MAG TPA: Cytosine specific methyltransferase [Caudoviricetes sp.]
MEAVRIIKEMRRATHGSYPVVVIWENVPGAFSSNGGEDFRAVLEELARVEEPDASIPRPPRGGADGAKPEQLPEMDGPWLGDSSTLNIGECPREENVSLLSWILQVDVPEKYYLSAKACRGILTRASRRGKKLQELLETALLEMIEWRASRGGQAYTLKIRSGCAGGGKGALVQTEKTGTLSTLQDQTLFQPVYCLAGNIIDRSETAGANGSGVKENQCYTLNTVDRPAVAYKVFDARGNGDGKTVPTITGDHESRVTDYTAIITERQTFSEQSYSYYKKSDKCSTMKAKAGNVGNGSECLIAEKTIHWIVRRLTPTECERLQGYPDGWTDIGEWTDTKGKKHKPADSPRYKALGNSIALPQWFWIAQKMKRYLPAGATLGSLFDGIGGFPLVWETTYGKGTARWASEIEEFPIAVTKRRFGNDSENEGDSGTVLCSGNCQCHKSCGDAETH